MPKYYVKSGELKFIIDCSDHNCAILSALEYYKNKKIMTSPKICVSEQGFEDFKTWKCYDIDTFTKESL
jgi:hypothetical protein